MPTWYITTRISLEFSLIVLLNFFRTVYRLKPQGLNAVTYSNFAKTNRASKVVGKFQITLSLKLIQDAGALIAPALERFTDRTFTNPKC